MVTPAVLGVDPSLAATGLAFPDGTLAVVGGAAKLGDYRLAILHHDIVRACQLYRPVLAVVEDLPTHAHGAGKTGMAQGVVRLALQSCEVPYALMPAATLKKFATGSGNAGKPDLRMSLFRRTGADERDPDKVDAAWLRYAGLDWLGAPAFDLPKIQRAALDKVAWPNGGTP